jgi:hypothetical protein
LFEVTEAEDLDSDNPPAIKLNEESGDPELDELYPVDFLTYIDISEVPTKKIEDDSLHSTGEI